MVSGIGGKIVSSPDGASWTSEATNVAAFLTNVVYDGSRFLSLGYNFTTIEAATVVSSPPLIVGNPSNATINEGGNASFTVAASNTNSYQWQVNTGAGFSNIVNSSTYSGATTSTLTITGATVGMNGYQYRVIATGSTAPSATSNSATLTVKASSIASTIMFKSNDDIAGDATVVSDGQGGSDDIPGFALDFSAKAAANPNENLVLTYEIPYPDTIGASGLSAGYEDNESQSIWTIKSRNSSQNFSLESITLIDSGTKDVKIGAFNDGIQVGEWVDLTISVDPWKFTFDHSNGLNFSFDNIDEIRIIPQDSEMWTSINDVQIGDPVTRPAPSITSNPSNATINEGDSASFTVAASNASSYQWQVDTGAGFTNISDNTDYTGATTATLVIKGATAGMSGYQYRVVASGSTTPAATSNSATLTVIPMNVPLADFANTSKTGTSATFTWSAATGATSLKIEQSPTGANTWTTATTGALATNATTATVTGLSAATGYDFRLVVTGGANAGNSNVVNVTTNSVALIDFASTSKTGTSATFTWSAATGATGLKIEQSLTGENTWTTATTGALATNATTATVTGLSAATGYDFRLVVTGGANAGNSNVVNVTTNSVALIDFASSSKTGTSATFTWSAATGATNIKVEQSPTGTNTWTTATTGALSTNATTATVTGLSVATGYDFRLVVTGGANAGDSNVVTITTNPIALTDFASASKTGTSATFTWSAATGATGLKIEQSPTGTNTWTTATTGALATNATTATVTGLSATTGYDFRLVVTGGANAGDSNVVTITTNPIALTDFASASKTGTSATFTWSASTGATNIKVEQSPTGTNTWTTATTDAIATNATVATVTGLSAATGYDFRLVVTGGANAGDSNVVTVTTNPIALTDFASASKTGTSATFTWSAAMGATGLKIEQSPTGANTWTTATTGVIATNATTATVTALSAATGYDFRLVVTGGANAGDSNVVTVTTNPIALADFASVSKSGTSATFTWSAAIAATNIEVEQSPTGANTWTTATTGALSTNATTATVTGLLAATGYDFRLVVTGGANAGDSNVVTITTNPIALTNFASASKTGTSATFTWSAATGATNIKVEQSPTGANTWTTATTGTLAANATTATVTGLSAATGYDFRLVVTGGANAGNSNILTVTTYSIEPSQPNPPKTDETDVEVLVNGKIEYAGKATTAIVNNQKVTTIIVDPNKLKKRLESEAQHAVITIPLKGSSDVYASQINGQIISDLEQKQAILVLQHDQFTYTIPASQISIDALTKLFGKKLNLQDLKLEIEIAKPLADTIKMVESAAVKGQSEMVVPPLNFTVRASYDGKTIEVSKFDAYVERMIAIPAGVDPKRITTGIVVEPNGSVRHVPTRLVVKNEKYEKFYAVVNSLTNSTYTIVWHPLAFKDVERHWAKEAVNDMGSRMVITGVGNEMFNPNKSITRAEFAAIIVRGLGLKLETSSSSFSDVSKNEWYSSYIQTAFANGLINGYEDGTFRPMDKITREQAMAIIAKAMKITGLKPSLAASEAGELLLPYKDANAASEWAKSSILDCLQVEIFSGRSSTVLAPKDEITRAEVAVIIQRLLKKSNLI